MPKADAILMGAIGLPNVKYSDGRPVGEKVVFGLRMGLDLYANVRPVRLLDGVESSLRWKASKDIDFVIVRENTEDLYARIQGVSAHGGLEETGIDVRVVTSKGSERVALTLTLAHSCIRLSWEVNGAVSLVWLKCRKYPF